MFKAFIYILITYSILIIVISVLSYKPRNTPLIDPQKPQIVGGRPIWITEIDGNGKITRND